ncbi:probable calcium-binding protein CML43 [Argentina anserina]|uniref:probable calcium-binding protein CML43 n=1 Tax=Argentina anserina TaxID=57926 RepID=UPI00217691DB|nr:probable calcium-binding protein CML43 [Potentilla anserina]
MLGITGVCSRLIGDLVRAFHGVSKCSSTEAHIDEDCKPKNAIKFDESMARALMTVFGMETNGRIKKEKAKRVVENLGLICYEEENEDKSTFDLPGDDDHDEVPVEEVLGELESDDGSKRNEMLLEAFKIFDVDGDGFIEAVELKRVLECLGLDNGWEMAQIEKMVKVVDLNLDGKVDFSEFELMMR